MWYEAAIWNEYLVFISSSFVFCNEGVYMVEKQICECLHWFSLCVVWINTWRINDKLTKCDFVNVCSINESLDKKLFDF